MSSGGHRWQRNFKSASPLHGTPDRRRDEADRMVRRTFVAVRRIDNEYSTKGGPRNVETQLDTDACGVGNGLVGPGSVSAGAGPCLCPCRGPRPRQTNPIIRAVGVRLSGNDLPGPIDSLQDVQDTGKMLFNWLTPTSTARSRRRRPSTRPTSWSAGFSSVPIRTATEPRLETRPGGSRLLPKQKPWLNSARGAGQATVHQQG